MYRNLLNFLLLPSILLTSVSLYSENSFSADQAEVQYKRKVQRLNERHKDYYLRKKKQIELEEYKKTGYAFVKNDRAKKAKAKELRRQNYIKKRDKALRSKTSFTAENFEKKKKLREKNRNKVRAKYISKREKLKILLKTSKNIPAEEELELIPERDRVDKKLRVYKSKKSLKTN